MNLREIVSSIKRVSEVICSASNELVSFARHLDSSARGQTEKANESSSAVTEMSASIAQVTAGAQEVEKSSVDAETSSRQGAEIGDETSAALKRINKVVDESVINVENLDENSREIGKIVNVIQIRRIYLR